jgi:hypothetical protein
MTIDFCGTPMNPIPLGALNQLTPLADGLVAAAHATAVATRKLQLPGKRTHRGSALRPGATTPLWNELADAVGKSLQRRGEKVRLARLLGVSRQRLHVLVVSKTACPDAERTLQLLAWLRARQHGLDPA